MKYYCHELKEGRVSNINVYLRNIRVLHALDGVLIHNENLATNREYPYEIFIHKGIEGDARNFNPQNNYLYNISYTLPDRTQHTKRAKIYGIDYNKLIRKIKEISFYVEG